MITPSQVVARRRAARAGLLAQEPAFADGLDPQVGVRGVAVFGSVARGDWNDASDVDVVVIAERLPRDPLSRLAAVGVPPGRVAPVVWSVTDWHEERRRGNPVATGAADDGVWLVGSAEALDQAGTS